MLYIHYFLLIVLAHFCDVVLPRLRFSILLYLGRLEAFMYNPTAMGR